MIKIYCINKQYLYIRKGAKIVKNGGRYMCGRIRQAREPAEYFETIFTDMHKVFKLEPAYASMSRLAANQW